MKRAGWTRRSVLIKGAAAGAGLLTGCVGTSAGTSAARRGAGAAGASSTSAASSLGAPDELAGYDALGLAELVRRGETSASELLEGAIARCEALNPSLNAVVLPHFERARDQVRRDALGDGPFRGVPFLLKDLGVELEGTKTTHGSRFWKGPGSVAKASSFLVERYEKAGLVIFGKTASPEFGSSSSTESMAYGETQNPWRHGFSSGGSSGGSAAAVAAGIVPAAHASDGGGSIRIPASCCGLFGLKPTRGRTPRGRGHFDQNAGLSIDHAVTRTVRDSAALLDATHGAGPRDPYFAPPVSGSYLDEVGRAPKPLRIGLQLDSALPVEVAADCLGAARASARLCESLGHHVEEIAAPELPGDLWKSFSVLRGTSIAMSVQAREKVLGRKAGPEDLEPNNWADYERARAYSSMDFERERQRIYAVARTVQAHQADFDVVLSPTLAIPPPPLGVLDPKKADEAFAQAAMAMAAFTIAYNVSGQPAMSVPLSWNAAGLPIGSMFVAGYGREDLLFRLGAQLESAQPWRGPALN